MGGSDRGGGDAQGKAGVRGKWGWFLLCVVLAAACGGVAFSLAGRRGGAEEAPALPRAEMEVEVLNGCGMPGIAAEAARALQRLGFDVVRTGNADSFAYPHTLAVDRSGRAVCLEAVADVLGCEERIQQLMPEALLDVTVILGADCLELPGLAGVRRGASGG